MHPISPVPANVETSPEINKYRENLTTRKWGRQFYNLINSVRLQYLGVLSFLFCGFQRPIQSNENLVFAPLKIVQLYF